MELSSAIKATLQSKKPSEIKDSMLRLPRLVKANADAMCMVRDASRLQTPLRCTNGSESVCPWLIHEISSCILFAFVSVFEQSKADVYNLQVSRVVRLIRSTVGR